MNEPKVSVIICCYTEERLEDIHEAMESVLAQTLRPHEVIIAVDHNKQLYERLAETYRDSIEIGRNSINLNQSPNPRLPIPIVLVLNEGAPGLSETRNVGIRAATGDIISFMDDDTIAEPEWLYHLTKWFHNPNVVAVGGRAVAVWPKRKRPLWFPEELDWIVGCTYKGLPLNRNEVRNVLGCNMAFKQSILNQVGLFRTDLGRVGKTKGIGEETELCIRIRQMVPGTAILYEPASVVHHKVVPSRLKLRFFLRRSYDEGFYKVKVQRLHQPTQQTLSTQQTQKTLSTEGSYLRYLLFKSIPQRLGQFYKEGRLFQAGAIIISIAATGTGYIWGRVRG